MPASAETCSKQKKGRSIVALHRLVNEKKRRKTRGVKEPPLSLSWPLLLLSPFFFDVMVATDPSYSTKTKTKRATTHQQEFSSDTA